MAQHAVQPNLKTVQCWGIHKFRGEIIPVADCSHYGLAPGAEPTLSISHFWPGSVIYLLQSCVFLPHMTYRITRVISYTVFKCLSGLETMCWLFFWCFSANAICSSILKSVGLCWCVPADKLAHITIVRLWFGQTDFTTLGTGWKTLLCRLHKVLILSYAVFGYSLKCGFVLEMFVMDQVLPIFLQLA